MKNVLITGASGFLGTHFIDYLESQDIEINTLGLGKDATFSCDISRSIPSITTRFDLVIHTAGKAHIIPKNEGEKQQFYDINFKGTKNLCKALEENLPDTFVFISTIAVYGLEEGSDIKETASLEGTTPYAKSKIMAEKYLQDWAKGKKVNLVILRLPLVAGKDPKGNLGAMINGIKKGYYFNISGSNALKSIVLAEDIAKLIPTLLGKNGVYNLSGDRDYTFKEISEIIAIQLKDKKILNLPYSLVKFLAVTGDVLPFFPIDSLKLKKMMSTLTVSSEKAKRELGWNPRSLKEGFVISGGHSDRLKGVEESQDDS